MTEQLGALACLIDAGRGETALAAFHDRWRHERLVIDKWFALQTSHARPGCAVTTAERPDPPPRFRLDQPQPLPRALRRAGVGNHAGFHQRLGRGL
jgi:aminopeptidase N